MNRILVIIHIFILLISCKPKADHTNQTLFRYNCENDITSLDPAFASSQDNIWAVTQLFNGLVQLDSNLSPIPCIAKRWNVSDDGKIYTFELRNDVYFHPNSCFQKEISRKVRAADFAYSFERIRDPKTASPGAWIFNEKVENEGFRALDDSTFQIVLKEPFAPFIGILTMPYCSVVPESAVKAYGKDFSLNPVGTGPFILSTWEESVALVFERNVEYFEKESITSNIDAVHISFIHNRQMALLLFLEGKLDMYSGLSGAIKDFILTKEGELQPQLQEKVNLQIMPFLNTEYLAINVDEGKMSYPWNNIDFRRAVSLAINRDKMLTHLRNNIGHPADGGFIPVGLKGFSSNLKTFDLDRSKQLLKQSGYLDNPIEITLTTTKDYVDLCIYVQKQLKDLGISCKLDVIPSSQLKEEKRQGNLSFFRASWILDYPDAENYLSCFASKNFAPSGPNYTHFKSKEFDQLYDKSLIETNDSVRYQMYEKMDQIILNEAPIIVLFYDESIRLTQKWVSDLPNNALNIPILKNVKIHHQG